MKMQHHCGCPLSWEIFRSHSNIDTKNSNFCLTSYILVAKYKKRNNVTFSRKEKVTVETKKIIMASREAEWMKNYRESSPSGKGDGEGPIFDFQKLHFLGFQKLHFLHFLGCAIAQPRK